MAKKKALAVIRAVFVWSRRQWQQREERRWFHLFMLGLACLTVIRGVLRIPADYRSVIATLKKLFD